MACYDGETLFDRISRGALDIDEVIRIALEVTQGLKAAHEQGIVHRDIKSSNIMLTAKDQVKIMDFGLARRFDQTMVTKVGNTLGTVPYMSPEQARGERADHRTDIWSLGVVLYEMITGQLPFQSPYSEAIVYSILNVDPPSLASFRSNIPAELDRIILKALRKDPAQRYQSAADLLAEVIALQKRLKTGVQLPFAKQKERMKRWKMYGAVALLVALAVSAILYFSPAEVHAVNSLAVLPLVNLSGDPEQDYFAEGIQEALLTDLAKLSGLRRVIARSSAMRYQKTDKPLSQIARELNVEALITGSVLRSGGRVRITAQLIDPRKDQQIWAERYERDFRDVLSVQNEIVIAIASQIKLQLTLQEQEHLATVRQINPEAYEAYLKGMYYLNKFTPEAFEKGLASLQKAVDKDPGDPYAYAGLALGYCLIGHERFPDAFVRARAAARRAEELGGMLAETQLALAEIKFYSDWDVEGAGKELRVAVELNPSLAEAHRHFSWYLNVTGRRDEAFSEMRRAEAVDPLSPTFAADIGWQYWLAEEDDSAISEARRSLELDPNFAQALTVVGYGYAAKGMFAEAIEAHQKAAKADKDWRWPLARTYALAGRRDDAVKLADELKKELTPINAWGLTGIYAALGETSESIRWLEAARKLRFSWIPWIGIDPSFAPLRRDPRFQEIARSVNLRAN